MQTTLLSTLVQPPKPKILGKRATGTVAAGGDSQSRERLRVLMSKIPRIFTALVGAAVAQFAPGKWRGRWYWGIAIVRVSLKPMNARVS